MYTQKSTECNTTQEDLGELSGMTIHIHSPYANYITLVQDGIPIVLSPAQIRTLDIAIDKVQD